VDRRECHVPVLPLGASGGLPSRQGREELTAAPDAGCCARPRASLASGLAVSLHQACLSRSCGGEAGSATRSRRTGGNLRDSSSGHFDARSAGGEGSPADHQGVPASSARPPGAAFRLGLSMIIVSEPSVKATQPVHVGRSTPTRNRSSATHQDPPRHADIRPISVHTDERAELEPRTGRRDAAQTDHRELARDERARGVLDVT